MCRDDTRQHSSCALKFSLFERITRIYYNLKPSSDKDLYATLLTMSSYSDSEDDRECCLGWVI